MRTLNWRRIPKKKVLSQQVCQRLNRTSKSQSNRCLGGAQRRQSCQAAIATVEESSGELEESESDDEKNVWFLIAEANKSIRKSSARAKESREAGGDLSRPVTSASSKSASKIKEMLESVRRRMAAVTTSSGPTSSDPLHRSPPGLNLISSNYLEQLRNQRKPRSVLEAIDFNDLENLFCLSNQPVDHLDESSPSFVRRSSWRTNASSDSVISVSNSYHSNESNGADDDADSDLELIENILDSKKSLNVNIFLKQLKSQDELIRQINETDHAKVGKEKLENLLKLLPDELESAQLMRFHHKQRQHRLPVAEKFLLQLVTRISSLKLRIKFMILQEKYSADFEGAISPELDKIEAAVREIRKSKMFRDLLNLVLLTGNFLNTGGYAADAAGFGLDCLDRLNEVRSNKEGIYLIHYVAEVAKKMHLVDFLKDELTHVEGASKVCLESIKLDLSSMGDKINELKSDIDKEVERKQTEANVADQEFLFNLLRTLEDIKCNVKLLRDRTFAELENTRRSLADYLCEDPETFNLHDCFSTILTFSQRLRTASDENERRLRLEMSRSGSSLRRSNTINPRLPKSSTGSLGGRPQLTGSRQSLASTCSIQSSTMPMNDYRPRMSLGGQVRRESAQATSVKSSTSNLTRAGSVCGGSKASSLSLPPHVTSASATISSKQNEYDELHEGLMKLLNDSGSGRRHSDSRAGGKGHIFGMYGRRTSRLFTTSNQPSPGHDP